MVHVGSTTSFQDIQETQNIGLDVRLRMLQRVPNTGLRRQMNDAFTSVLMKQPRDGVSIGKVQKLEAEVCIRAKLIESSTL
jgi:hypothetical protein